MAELRYRRETYLDDLVDFAIMLRIVGDDGDWHDVLRYDCAHNCVHVHHFGRSGEEPAEPSPIRAIDAQYDVREGYDLAEREIRRIWRDELRGWASA